MKIINRHKKWFRESCCVSWTRRRKNVWNEICLLNFFLFSFTLRLALDLCPIKSISPPTSIAKRTCNWWYPEYTSPMNLFVVFFLLFGFEYFKCIFAPNRFVVVQTIQKKRWCFSFTTKSVCFCFSSTSTSKCSIVHEQKKNEIFI